MNKLFLLPFLFLVFNLTAQKTYVPDDNFEQALIDLGHDDVLDDSVITANINEVITLFIAEKDISDLTGIEGFTAMQTLYCFANNLTSIEVSQNTNLWRLVCYANGLTTLDLSQCPSITHLECQYNDLQTFVPSPNLVSLKCKDNNLTELDLSNNPNLGYLDCDQNELTCLNMKNGNSSAMGTTSFLARSNPNLFCIEVDDPLYSESTWVYVDAAVNFTSDCANECSSEITSLLEFNASPRTLIYIVDLMGRETTFKRNTPLIYVYDDGSTEKVFSVEY